ncbi:hypothetical protein NFJ02_16g22930 [Pycnococcus provasolii]
MGRGGEAYTNSGRLASGVGGVVAPAPAPAPSDGFGSDGSDNGLVGDSFASSGNDRESMKVRVELVGLWEIAIFPFARRHQHL